MQHLGLKSLKKHLKSKWLTPICLFLVTLLAIAIFGNCPKPVAGLFPPQAGQSTRKVYIVRQAWHTGLAWSQRGLIPLGPKDWEDAPYVEIGWGDRRFYQMGDFSIGSVLSAVFIPTSSVMHVVGFAEPPADYFDYTDVWQLELSETGFQRMFEYVRQTFESNYASNSSDSSENETAWRRSPALGKGLYGESSFFPAIPSYGFWFTCNGWTAQALWQAGIPTCPRQAIFVQNIVGQFRRFAQQLKFVKIK